MNGRYLLDTNIVIALFAQESAVLNQLAEADAVFLPSIVIGELYFGARNSSRVAQNVERVEDFRNANSVLTVDSLTAFQYGRVKHELKLAGTPLPENDIWIAALALQHQLVLATRDSHFEHINSLFTVSWQD